MARGWIRLGLVLVVAIASVPGGGGGPAPEQPPTQGLPVVRSDPAPDDPPSTGGQTPSGRGTAAAAARLITAERASGADVTGPLGGNGEDLLSAPESGSPIRAFDGATGSALWRFDGPGFLVGRADVAGDGARELLIADGRTCEGEGHDVVRLTLLAPATGKALWVNDVSLGPCGTTRLVPWGRDIGWAGDLTGDGAPDVVIRWNRRDRHAVVVVDGRTGARAGVLRHDDEIAVVPHPAGRSRSLFLVAVPVGDERIRVELWERDGLVVWRSDAVSPPPHLGVQPVAVAGLTEDRRGDIVVVAGGEAFAFDGRTGDLLWRTEDRLEPTYGLVLPRRSDRVADVNGDGYQDLIFTRPGGGTFSLSDPMFGVLSGRDGTVLWEHEARAGGAEGRPRFVRPFVGRGSPDVVLRLAEWEDEWGSLRETQAFDGTTGWPLWETEGHDMLGRDLGPGEPLSLADSFDFDGDGIPDLWTYDAGRIDRDGVGTAGGDFTITLHGGRELANIGSLPRAEVDAEVDFSVTPIDVDGDEVHELLVRVWDPTGDAPPRAALWGDDGLIWRA